MMYMKLLTEFQQKLLLSLGNMFENVVREPILGKFWLSFKPIKTRKIYSIETKLIHGVDMMYIKLLTKFQQKLLLSF